jgi:hypothetical protein
MPASEQTLPLGYQILASDPKRWDRKPNDFMSPLIRPRNRTAELGNREFPAYRGTANADFALYGRLYCVR